MRGKKTVIIGGGVTGLFTAYFLVKKGVEVTVIDDGTVPGFHSCSYGNAGMIVPSHFIPLANPGTLKEGVRASFTPGSAFGVHWSANSDMIRWLARFLRNSFSQTIPAKTETLAALHLESRELFQQVQTADIPDLTLDLTGLVMVSSTSKSFDLEKRNAGQSISLGIPAEVWSPDTFRSLNPDIDARLAGAVYYPLDGKVDPVPMLQSLASWLKANGVAIIENCRLTGWKTTDHQIIAANSDVREFIADDFLICAGDRSGLIAKQLGCEIPLQPGKGLSFDSPNSGPILSHPTLLQDHHVAITPYEKHTRFAGNFLLGNRNNSIPQERLDRIRQSTHQVFPGLTVNQPSAETSWAGFRPVSPDGMPIIGRSKKWSNLFAGTGHAMMGISLGPVSGSILSNLVTGIPVKTAYERFLAPSRFGNSF